MRLLIVTILVSIVVGIGCTPYPRYKRGGAEVPHKVDPVNGKMSTNARLRFGEIIQKYLGKPYAGTSKYDDGFDCSLFTQQCYAEFDQTNLPRTSEDQFRIGKEIPHKQLRYGDLVFFRTERNRISHVGIYVGNSEFAHASSSKGVIISSMREKYWAKRYAGARRVSDAVN